MTDKEPKYREWWINEQTDALNPDHAYLVDQDDGIHVIEHAALLEAQAFKIDTQRLVDGLEKELAEKDAEIQRLKQAWHDDRLAVVKQVGESRIYAQGLAEQNELLKKEADHWYRFNKIESLTKELEAAKAENHRLATVYLAERARSAGLEQRIKELENGQKSST